MSGYFLSVGFWISGYVWCYLTSCQTPSLICPLVLLNQYYMRAIAVGMKYRLLQLTSYYFGAPMGKLTIFQSQPLAFERLVRESSINRET